MSAKVYCNGTDIRCLKKETLTVGMSGAVVEFEFSEEWAQLNKTAVFESDGTKTVQIAGGKAKVPHEILTTPGMDVLVGVYTRRKDGTTWPSPTPMCKIAQLKGGAKPDGDPSYPPTPDITQQLIDAIEQLKEETGVREFYVQDNEPTEQKGPAFWINPSETDEEYQSDVAKAATPKLTAAQKKALFDLAAAYRDGNPSFYYDYNIAHNDYANNSCWNAQENARNRFGLCCNTFVEMLWMGRAATDFIGKDGASYSNKIDKAFDWGYMFTFPERRAIAGEAERDENGKITGYYNFIQPNGDDTWSYSTNSRYDPKIEDTTKYPNHQRFNSFLNTDCVALELYRMGCEIPYDELDVGDLVFTKERWKADSEKKTFENNLRWRNISHVLMVFEKAADGTLTFIECSYPVDAQPILRTSTRFESKWTTARAIDVIGNVAMCARHPAAWGKGNMYAVDQIDYIPMSYTTGYSAGQAIPFDFGKEITEGLYYVYNNELAIARRTGAAWDWDGDNFEIKFTNAEGGE